MVLANIIFLVQKSLAFSPLIAPTLRRVSGEFAGDEADVGEAAARADPGEPHVHRLGVPRQHQQAHVQAAAQRRAAHAQIRTVRPNMAHGSS